MAGYALGFDDGGEVGADAPHYNDEERPWYKQDNGMAPVTGVRNLASAAVEGGKQISDALNAPEGVREGMPDVGDAPDFAYETPGEFVSKTGETIANDWNKGLENVGKSLPGRVAKRIVSYLMGDGAAAPQRAAQVTAQVKASDPQMSDDDANLLAVHQAGEMGGPGAAWAMVQYNRMAYNAKQAFAKAALNGVDGKAGDIAAAAQAATQAGAHILDGSSAVFTAGPQGVTATVTTPDRQRVQYQLTPQQFSDYLDVGKTGQWDRVMQGGLSKTLAQIAGGDNQAQASQEDGAQARTPPATRGKNFGETPSTMDISGGNPARPDEGPQPYRYDDELERQSSQMFPWISQEGQRQQFMAGQQNTQAERQNKLDVANAGNETKERIATIQGGSRERAAQTRGDWERDKQNIRSKGNENVARIQAEARAKSEQQRALAAAQKLEQQSNDARLRERGRMARAAVSNPNFLLQTDEQRNAIYKQFGIDQLMGGASAPQATTPQAPTPQATQQGNSNGSAPQRPANVPAGAKFYKGKWYTRGANGEAVPVE